MRAALFALILLSACTTAPAAPAGAIALAGTSWIRIDDENASPHNPTIVFEAARASGYDGCNRWFAAVTQNGEAIRFGDVAATRMGCAEAGNAAERNFLAALAATRYVRADGDALLLLDGNRRQLARLEPDR